jgi:hypothetical protein
VIFICALLLLGACKDDAPTIQEKFLPGVQNLRAISQVDGVILSWENPDDRAYNEVEISYTFQGEEMVIKESIDKRNSTVDIILPDSEVYKFYVKGISLVNGTPVEEHSVKGRRLVAIEADDELAGLLNSIDLQGGDNGVRVFWENSENIQALIRLEYDGQVHDIDAANLNKEYTLKGLDLNKQYTFVVGIVYEGEPIEPVRTLSATALEKSYRMLKDDGWTIIASSEQTAQPASNLLDNDPNTYWRSSVLLMSGGAPTGQHVIVDLKSSHLISAVTLRRRWGNDENSSWDTNISVSEDGVTYTTPYMYKNASTDANPIFKVEFNRTVDGQQMFLLPYTHTARYVRLDFVRGAGSAYAVYGDLNFYGE